MKYYYLFVNINDIDVNKHKVDITANYIYGCIYPISLGIDMLLSNSLAFPLNVWLVSTITNIP